MGLSPRAEGHQHTFSPLCEPPSKDHVTVSQNTGEHLLHQFSLSEWPPWMLAGSLSKWPLCMFTWSACI